MAYAKRSATKTRKRTFKRRAGTRKVSKTVKSYVKKAISRRAENKYAARTVGLITTNGRNQDVGDVNLIVPTIAQGVNAAQRIGSSVTAKSMRVRGHVIATFSEDKIYKRAMGVRILCLRNKQVRDYALLNEDVSLWIFDVLRKGALVKNLDNTIEDFYLPVNTDSFQVIADKRMIISSPVATGTDYAVNARNCVKFFNFSVPCLNKRLRYSSSGDSTCNNFAPFILVQYCYLDGTSPDVLNTELAFQYYVDMRYEDA